MKISVHHKKINDLTPYIGNTRTHSPEQIAQVAASIKEFGFTNPILIDEDNGLIAGHARLQAAIMLELAEVPCIVLDGLTEAQKKAYVIADNKLAMNAGWNYDALIVEFERLKELDFDLELTGFSPEEMTNIFSLNFGQEVDHAGEWEGMPEYANEDKTAFRSIIVHFKCQEHVDEFEALVNHSFTDKTKMMWFPEIEIETTADKVYTNEA